MTHPVIAAAQQAFLARLADGATVSDHTRNAQAICKAWRAAVFDMDPSRYQCEVSVAPELEQRIDIYDRKASFAFEFKVSGKNATAEFYRNVVKALLWNERRADKLRKLAFITEEKWGRPYLDASMPKAYVAFVQKHHDIAIEIAYVRGA
jgi:hypothetical protein